ncbi:SDR family NAD(P)-dependent oxidoreductase [Amycolatopsis anabasis]|uniref:SDR family NAD(P)-dependent oxidoreductase n=1 Tax=Amycolatopsis anabasis TaxID=1840409 RepID=UPI00131AD485|nr:SDR family NAD(P)-dependent oxidoreductase [Amycolatopsis anabasis]
MSSRTLVVSGGTDGIGRALGLAYLRRGEQVAIIGRNTAKGDSFLAEADMVGAAGRAHVITADLSLVAGARAAIAAVRERFDRVDALVLGARHVSSHRQVTAEGFELTFALYYLSRFLLSHELADLLDAAPHPVVANVSGPGETRGDPRWDDLNLARGYTLTAALSHGGRLNDLLAVGWGMRHPMARTRYVLVHPGVVATSFSGTYDPRTAAVIDQLRSTGAPVAEAIQPIARLLDDPPVAPVSAWAQGSSLPLTRDAFDPAAARRLYDITMELLQGEK